MLPRVVFTDEFVEFTGKCLRKAPTERANCVALMAHPFFKQYDGAAASDDAAAFTKWVRAVIDRLHLWLFYESE